MSYKNILFILRLVVLIEMGNRIVLWPLLMYW